MTVNGSIYYTLTGRPTLSFYGRFQFDLADIAGDPVLREIRTGGHDYRSGSVFGAPEKRYSLSATATIYLVTQAGFLTTTLQDTGHIHARRMR